MPYRISTTRLQSGNKDGDDEHTVRHQHEVTVADAVHHHAAKTRDDEQALDQDGGAHHGAQAHSHGGDE